MTNATMTNAMTRVTDPLLFLGLLVSASVTISGVAAKEAPATQPALPRQEAQVSDWLEKNRDRPPAVRAFVQRMPKGGDIHSHLSGAVYAEHYLEWASQDGYCVDPAMTKLVSPPDCRQSPTYFPVSDLFKQTGIYDSLVNRWSTRNLAFSGKSGHDQFFQAFAGFDLISSSSARRDDMVAEVANRAASQHIAYLELMLTFQGNAAKQLAPEVTWNGNFADMRRQLLDKGLMAWVTKGKQEIDELERQTLATLGCGTPKAQPGCRVTVRFLQQTNRVKSPIDVFTQFVYAFELAKADPRLVGINLVAPEDNPVALRDYSLQMEMLKFLHGQFPEVKIALHAGELTLGLVPPDALRFHIQQAVAMAQARRIGHGVGILYEDNPWALLALMRQRGVLVEICLTSNEVILNVKGPDHPLPSYLAAGVPVTLASDDEGISRIDLSHEYQLAVLRYGLKYEQLKRFARNSLEYSFLAGESLWQSPTFSAMTTACAQDKPGSGALSKGCGEFLQKSDRAKVQWQLEADYAEFEALPWFQPGGS